MNEREFLFCKYYYMSQNPKEAAIKAGYSSSAAEKTAQQLLARQDINEYLEKIKTDLKKDQILSLVITALKRLIFCRPNDVLILALKSQDLSETQIENLDLFQISEIKKLKDGGFEFKFTDRIKAIECLISLVDKMDDDSGAENFFRALALKDGENFVN